MVVLIVPCYNEASRLDVEAFKNACHSGLRFVFVDDGSSDNTFEILHGHFGNNPFCKVLKAPKNLGKGEATRYGMNELQKITWWPDIKWAGLWDADLSTPLEEVKNFLSFKEAYPEALAVWGSRVYRLGAHIKRSPLRHYLGRGFATLVHHALHVEAYDTQCGAKLFNKEAVAIAFKDRFISRWIFDIEILLRLDQPNIVEYPLRRWEDVPGSKIRIGREIFRVLREIWIIRKKYVQKSL